MRVAVYGLPNCELCDTVFDVVSKAVARGRISGKVEKRMVDGTDSSVLDNLTELAASGYGGVPAVIVYDDGDRCLWGLDSITSIKQLRMSEIAKAQGRDVCSENTEVRIQEAVQ